MRMLSRLLVAGLLSALLMLTVAPAALAQTGPNNAITDVPGVHVGHSTRLDALTGTTALIFPDGALMGYAPAGGAPGNRLAALLTAPHQDSQRVVFHGLTLSGGSIYGLDTACGVVKYLNEQGLGFGDPPRPYVPGAIIFDLNRGGLSAPPGRSTPANPDPCSDGYIAASNATDGPIEQGSVGGGTGARAGGLKSGLGTASAVLPNGYTVGALVVVNSGGGVYNTRNNCELYTLWLEQDDEFGDVREPTEGCSTGTTALPPIVPGENTTIGVVATDAPLTAGQVERMAIIAGDGMARSIKPAHGAGDGDTVFGVTTTDDPGSVAKSQFVSAGSIYQVAADVYSRAITHAVLNALPGVDRETYCERFPTACPSGAPVDASAAVAAARTSGPSNPPAADISRAAAPAAVNGAATPAGATSVLAHPFAPLAAIAALLLALAAVARPWRLVARRAGHRRSRRTRLAWMALTATGLMLFALAAPAGAQSPGPSNSITDVPGVQVGHSTRPDAATGTTSLVLPGGSLMGFASASGAPETHLATLLTGQHQDTLRVAMHGLVLSGGSVYGLDTVCGTVAYLDEQGLGFGGRAHIPGATIFDLGRGAVDAPPGTGADPCVDGYEAASSASDGPVEQGSVGAGTGAMAGGLKGGLGSASTVLPDGTIVGALAVVNSTGRVYNALGRCELFGLELELDDEFGRTRPPPQGCGRADTSLPESGPLEGNVIGAVATSAPLTAGQTQQLARVVADAIAQSVRPAHANPDGNAIFGITLVENPAAVPQSTFVERDQLAEIYEAAVNAFSRSMTHAVLNADESLGETYCQRFPTACPPRGRPASGALAAPGASQPPTSPLQSGPLAVGLVALAALLLLAASRARTLRAGRLLEAPAGVVSGPVSGSPVG